MPFDVQRELRPFPGSPDCIQVVKYTYYHGVRMVRRFDGSCRYATVFRRLDGTLFCTEDIPPALHTLAHAALDHAEMLNRL